MFSFSWLLGFALSVHEKMIGFKGRYVDKMKITYKNKGDSFQADDICEQGYTYIFY